MLDFACTQAPDADVDVILSLEIIDAGGRGYGWRLRTAEGEIVEESPYFVSLYQCLTDARNSAVLKPGTDPYVRRG